VTPDQVEALQRLRSMFRHLADRAERGPGGVPAWLEDESAVDREVLRRLESAVRSLVGPEQFEEHLACERRARHARAQICRRCGFSDNLYLGALEKVLRRSS